MAVRSAYAFGLHREETLVIFPPEEQLTRRKIWRSLFILDRFLAVSLGRPVAISEEECSCEILRPTSHALLDSPVLDPHQKCAAGLEATVRSCHVMGTILRTVYQQRKISTELAQGLADQCKEWPEHLSPALHWRQASSENVRQAVAVLHCNITYCHSIILLTRPFFLYLLSGEIQRTRLNADSFPIRPRGKMQRFSDACMVASEHTVALVQNAYQGGYLPRLNPFPTYSIFTAALIIFANEFARPSVNALWAQCMQNSITILQYCGEMDPQAKSAANILIEFRDVIQAQANPNPFALSGANFPSPLQTGYSPGPSQTPGHQSFPSMPPLPGATVAPAFDSMPSFTTDSSMSTSHQSHGKSSTLAPSQLLDEELFSGLLDLKNTVLPTGTDPELSSADDWFEFDSLWHLPSKTPSQTPGACSPGAMQPKEAGVCGAASSSLFHQMR